MKPIETFPIPPVLVLAFRRPDLARQVVRAVGKAKPSKLFLACDGPRSGNTNEELLVEATRNAMEAEITWDCEVYRRYSTENYGCKQGVENAIEWFFDANAEGIILEDDCIPHADFFPYCAELLERYRDCPEVMHISGDGSLPYPKSRRNSSYVFSREALVWGWATWRRAWKTYDSELNGWHDMRKSNAQVRETFGGHEAAKWWTRVLDRLAFEGEPDSWAYRWSFTVFSRGGVCIVPRRNLIQNVGHRPDSTHTFDASSPRANAPIHSIIPLKHPSVLKLDKSADRKFQQQMRGYQNNKSARAAKLLRRSKKSIVSRSKRLFR